MKLPNVPEVERASAPLVSVGVEELDSVRTLVQVFRSAIEEDVAFRAEMKDRLFPYVVSLRMMEVHEEDEWVEFVLELRAPTHYGVRIVRTKERLLVRVQERPVVEVPITLREWGLDGSTCTATLKNGVVHVRVARSPLWFGSAP